MQQNIVGKTHRKLLKIKKTVAVAESCTGGIASGLLTQLSESSKYFMLGVVAYSNKAKTLILGIPAPLINKKGAVSCEVALKMAENVRKIAKTDYGIGITGIAGPTGGTFGKPVGTVFIALSSKKETICNKYVFSGNRAAVRKKSALGAIKLLYSQLQTPD